MKVSKEYREKRDKNITLAKTKATDHQWELCDSIIKSFIATYPKHWAEFTKMIAIERDSNVFDDFRLATKEHKDLRQSGWRNVLAWPVIEDDDGKAIDSLKEPIETIIPQLTHKYSVNLKEFIRRYPMLSPARRI
ncbi:MAG: hypothetical protein ACTSUP_01670 [Candidatus Heimdallarchaeaceae archaeon]